MRLDREVGLYREGSTAHRFDRANGLVGLEARAVERDRDVGAETREVARHFRADTLAAGYEDGAVAQGHRGSSRPAVFTIASSVVCARPSGRLLT